MKIRLKEVPKEGREYIFDRASGELNETLADLIGQRDFDVKLFIKPIGNAYEMRGKIKTTLIETCSNCGYEFEAAVERSVNEVLIEEQEPDRKAHGVHGNQAIDYSDSGPSMTPYRGDIFDAGEFVHEAIALAEPFYPMCGPKGECLNAEEVNEIKRRLESESAHIGEKKANPFDALKDLKIKKNQQ